MIVLIPAYQPDEQLVLLAKRFSEQTDFSLVVVNDGSSPDKDAVFAALPPEVTVLRHEKNRGKGCAMKTGMAYIWEHFSHDEGVVVVDADGQHLLPDVQRVCEALHENPDALVLGARRFTGNVPLRSKLGNTVTRYVFALASGVKIYDTQTGLRAFSVSRIPAFLALKGERYEYEMHMLLGAAQQHIPMIEVFIETVYLDAENSSSHFHPLRDSFRIYASILKFTCSSFAAFGIDYVMVLLLAFFYILFSVVFKIRSHRRRSIVTFGCFCVGCLSLVPIPAILLGCVLISCIVIYKHHLMEEKSNESANLIL